MCHVKDRRRGAHSPFCRAVKHAHRVQSIHLPAEPIAERKQPSLFLSLSPVYELVAREKLGMHD